MTCNKFHAEDPQILDTSVQKISRYGDVAPGICAPLGLRIPYTATDFSASQSIMHRVYDSTVPCTVGDYGQFRSSQYV